MLLPFVRANAAARAPCDIFDPWVRWERSNWDLKVRLAAASGSLGIWESGNIESKKNVRMKSRYAQNVCRALISRSKKRLTLCGTMFDHSSNGRKRKKLMMCLPVFFCGPTGSPCCYPPLVAK